jgi:hypothetical protein
MAGRFYDRLPLWSFFPIGLVVLFAGMIVIGLIEGPSEEGLKNAALIRKSALWALVLIPPGEVLLWTVAFTEAVARAFRAPLTGAMLGVFGYGVLYHAPYGINAVVSATWLGVVLACVYLAMRERSLWAATLTVICIKCALIAFPYFVVAPGSP